MSFDNYKKRLLEVKTWLKDYSTTLEYQGEIPKRIFDLL